MQCLAQTNVNSELALNFVVAVLLLLLIVVRWRFKRQYMPGDALKRLGTDKLDLLLIVPCFLGMMLSILAYLVMPGMLQFAHVALPQWLRWCGLPLGLAALVLMNTSDRTLGRNFSVAIEIQQDHRLITDGPYRLIRHPIYAAVMLLGVSLSLLSADAAVFFCWCVWTIPVFAYRIRQEERLMEKHFGSQYKDYCQSTRRVIPGVW